MESFLMNNLDKLAPALVALQADLKPVSKSKTNPFYKSSYAPLSEVMESIQPLLATHSLAISQFMTHLNGDSALRTLLVHSSGQYIEDTSPLLLTKKDAQSQGSAVTYARRYGIMSVLGIVADEDDDGNKASRPAPKATEVTVKKGVLERAKDDLNKQLEAQDYTTPDSKRAFIKDVLGKVTITTIDDAEAVADALDNEK